MRRLGQDQVGGRVDQGVLDVIKFSHGDVLYVWTILAGSAVGAVETLPRPHAERVLAIVYRARNLPFYVGRHGQRRPGRPADCAADRLVA